MNLSVVGQDDSSSEENEKLASSKPAIPPRTRNVTENGQGVTAPPRRHGINKDKGKSMLLVSLSTFLYFLTCFLYSDNRNSVPYERKKSVDMDGNLTNALDDHNFENLDVSTVQCK